MSRHLSTRRLLLLVLPLLMTACGKEEAPDSRPQTYPDLETSLATARREAIQLLGTNGEKRRALWDQRPEAERWTALTLEVLRAKRQQFEAARDLEEFCPGYGQASNYQKETCWLRIVSAMARYESNFRPNATYLERSGTTSVGLLMMNPDHCAGAPSIEKLKNAEANIACALPRLARFIGRDGYLSGPANLGGARYWSVLRVPYRQDNLFLGRRPHIQIFTKSYAAFIDPAEKKR